MGRFYLDLEYTNGNYYLADIIEISIVAGDHEFHRYINIRYPVPPIVKRLTGITNTKLNAVGCSFKEAMHALVDFISKESAAGDPPIIIAQGGYLFDFPILLAKYGFQDFDILQRCKFVDSVQLLRSAGYARPGLAAICDELGLSRPCTHSALDDARLFKVIFERLLLQPTHEYSVLNIHSHLCLKMPLPIPQITQWAGLCYSSQELQSILLPYVRDHTALSANQVAKISNLYFKYYA